MPNPDPPVTLTPITSAWGADVVGRVVLTFPAAVDADAYYAANAPAAGQMHYLDNPAMLRMFDGSAWKIVRQLDADYGWRDPNAGWGRVGGASAVKPADPIANTIFSIGDTNAHDLAADNVCPAAAFVAVANRVYAVNALVRVDGASMQATQTQTVTVRLVDGAGVSIVETSTSLSAFGSAGNWSDVANLWARWVPPPGPQTVRVIVQARYAGGSLPLLVKYPVGVSVTDEGLAAGATPQGW